jgi:YHS domain-containing protein
MLDRRSLLALAGATVLTAAIALPLKGAQAQKTAPVFTGLVKGVAVGGYDPVAYFTESKPVKGKPELSLEHEGAQWHFASEANREAFKKEPAKYAPQYGGYCAWAVSQGYTAKGDPDAWTIHNGKLYINYNRSVRSSWAKAIDANITKGDGNWPKVLEK